MGTFCMSGSESDMQKVAEARHKALRTRAMASEKVGKGFSYQAAERTGVLGPAGSRRAATVTQEKPQEGWSGSANGQVRPLALGLHSQVGPSLLKGDLQLPAQYKPLNCPDGFHGKLGAQ